MAKCGRITEVFSRVSGYHRPVSSWNRGKKEEFKDRLVYHNDKNEKLYQNDNNELDKTA